MDNFSIEMNLRLLGDLMDLEKTPPIRLVVSGGAALIARGIVERATNDIDVFAVREWEGDLERAYPLPEWFREITARIAKQRNLSENWLNAATSLVFPDLFRLLPADCWTDLDEISLGERLRISYLSRTAQMYLKAYALVNRDEARDLDDFRSLTPTASEIEMVSAWLIDSQLASSVAVAKFKNLVV